MHSSRMLTVRSSGRISGGVPGPGGCVPGWGGLPGSGGVYLVQGGTWSGGAPGLGGCTWFQGDLVPGGAPGQVFPPPVDRQTPVKT